MNKVLNYILIGLIFLATTLIIYIITQFGELVKYREQLGCTQEQYQAGDTSCLDAGGARGETTNLPKPKTIGDIRFLMDEYGKDYEYEITN